MVDNTASQTDIKTINLASGQTTATADYELYASHRYTFLLWADDGSYNATDLTNITLNSSSLSRTQAGLSYAATATWDGSSSTITATLNHVASKVTLKTTTATWTGNTLTLTVPQASTGYNVQTGTATATTEEYEHSIITTDITASETSPVELFSFYVLAADELQDLTLSCDGGSITVPVNLSGGKHITLTGDVGGMTGDVGGMTEEIPTSSTLDVSFGAWDNVTIELDNILSDATVASTFLEGGGTDTNPYLITSAADFKCYLENNTYGYSYVHLDTDIEIATDSWRRVYVSMGGTFDGNNHTISGTLNCAVGADDCNIALFTSVDGTVCNLNVEADIAVNGNISAPCNVGGIAAACSNGTIDRCTYSGKISGQVSVTRGSFYAGGIVGHAQGGKVSNCTFSGEIEQAGFTADQVFYVGGIVGYNSGSDLTTGNDYSKGNPSTLTGND